MEKTLLKLAATATWFAGLVLSVMSASDGKWDEATYWLIFIFGALLVEKLSEIVFHLMAVNYHLLKLIKEEKQNDTSSS